MENAKIQMRHFCKKITILEIFKYCDVARIRQQRKANANGFGFHFINSFELNTMILRS